MSQATLSPDAATLARLFRVRMSEVTGAAMIGGRVALGVAGALLTTEIKRLISLPYPPASVPSEPPHMRRGDDGGLHGAYDYDVESDDTVAVGASGPGAEAAAFLEMGTTKMKPRPHVRPAVANLVSSGMIGQAFQDHVAESIRRAVG